MTRHRARPILRWAVDIAGPPPVSAGVGAVFGMAVLRVLGMTVTPYGTDSYRAAARGTTMPPIHVPSQLFIQDQNSSGYTALLGWGHGERVGTGPDGAA
ncbi:hypothetical protein GCM10010394_64310 [Streptomyces crystallinus]|uniref:Uncharacterized protein n=1 Tax=Streptomyces crystallinus TaxID=68191 RepID=A0ABP3S6X1_9ACTN